MASPPQLTLLVLIALLSTSPRLVTGSELRGWMERARIPGVSLAVIEGHEMVQVEAVGIADSASGEPVTEATLFEAASLSKPVFAAVVLRLAERGELDLDRPLLELLENERIAHDPRASTLTARHVLSHQTGLPNWGPPERLELRFTPGWGFGYSGEGFVYLQHVVEELTGLTLDEVARREIFEPLGMTRSRFSWLAPETVAADEAVEGEGAKGRREIPGESPQATALPVRPPVSVATPHDIAGRPQEKRMPREGNAAASLQTTASEYARFVIAWVRGELVSARTLAVALKPTVWVPRRQTAEGEEPERYDDLAWGLGWGLELAPASSGVGLQAVSAASASGDTPNAPEADLLLWHWGDNGPAKAFVAYRAASGNGFVYFANSQNGLAIAPALAKRYGAPLDSAWQWQVYDRLDDPGFEERLAGAAAEAERDYVAARERFRAALAAKPDDGAVAQRIEWLEDLIAAARSPVEVPLATLARWAGGYGPRTLRFEDSELYYRREGRPEYRVIPLSDTLLALEGLVEFRLEVVTDETGRPTALRGHYLGGEPDETSRDSEDSAER